MSEFFAMGGYAFYVWGSFGVTALVVVIETTAVHSRRKRALEEARLATPDNLTAARQGVL
jgi:heme exporter protein D